MPKRKRKSRKHPAREQPSSWPNLGDKVFDRITGLRGVVTARVEYLYGKPMVLIEASNKISQEKRIEELWVYEERAMARD